MRMLSPLLRRVGMSLLVASSAYAVAARCSAADDAFFRERVAPLLERHCVHCHQGVEPKGGLSLENAERVRQGGESGAALAPGDPDKSLLLEYISGEKPEMPKNAPPLSAADVSTIREWIAGGASWPADLTLVDKRQVDTAWWSLAPLSRPAVPAVDPADAAWVRTPIDAFIAARLRQEGLSPAPEADRRTLIRRLYFDLVGLPPSPEEIAAFDADPAPDAYERLIDRLLNSTAYGERWGRHWLDVVHFGETHGYDKDKKRPNAWPYCDYVIRSFNQDKPYSRFVEEQLAGDVLFPDDADALVATGFIAAGPWDFVGHVELREGTVDKEIARSNDRDDMVMTTVSTFLSLTAHCARCHNHKFDPIPQSDYYRLQAVFAGVDRADRPYDADPQTAHTRRELAAAQQSLNTRQAALTAAIARLGGAALQAADARLAEIGRQLAALAKADGPPDSPTNGYHSGIMPAADALKWVQVDLGLTVPLDELRLIPARPTDFPDSPGFGFPQRFTVAISNDPDFAVFDLLVDHSGDDFANPGDKPVVISATGKSARYVRVTANRLWLRTNDYVFALAELQAISASRNVAFGAQVKALDSIEAGRWSTAHLVDGYDSRHRLADAPHADRLRRQRDGLETDRKAALAERERLIDSRLDDSTRRERDAVVRESADLAWRLAALPPQQMVYAAAPAFAPAGNFTSAGAKPRTVHFLNRGNVKNPGEPMSPGALSCLPGLDSHFALADEIDEGSRRAALARWITDPRNVLTRRSIVNRVWQYHFGRGIVDTPNDFGRMGSQPTHPELLDWLAIEFFETGESLKRLHRLILTSAVYRQSSRGQETGERMDAANRFLWRMNRRRLDAECVRDAVLAVTGMLDRRAGGPSDEQFYFKDDHSPVYDYERFNVDDPRGFRRSVYRFIVRSVPDPFMDCLDCADPSILTPKRNTTLTALQALAMLNDRFIISQSRHFAERVRRLAPDRAGQIAAAFLLALGRRPTAEELAALVDYAERFGLANACRVVLNSNEFMFID